MGQAFRVDGLREKQGARSRVPFWYARTAAEKKREGRTPRYVCKSEPRKDSLVEESPAAVDQAICWVTVLRAFEMICKVSRDQGPNGEKKNRTLKSKGCGTQKRFHQEVLPTTRLSSFSGFFLGVGFVGSTLGFVRVAGTHGDYLIAAGFFVAIEHFDHHAIVLELELDFLADG